MERVRSSERWGIKLLKSLAFRKNQECFRSDTGAQVPVFGLEISCISLLF